MTLGAGIIIGVVLSILILAGIWIVSRLIVPSEHHKCSFCPRTFQEGINGAVIKGVACCDVCAQPGKPGHYLLNR